MFQLSENDQQTLLKIARDSVQTYLAGRTLRLPEITQGVLAGTHGVFVSIHRQHELRGCIGNVHPATPLFRTTSECAVSAAVGDPRFMPMMSDELSHVHFELSVLSPMEKIENVSQLEIGRDGLLISKRGARGLLLPQVATAYGWGPERFLEETCRKAGLRPSEWKEDATIFRFTAHVFQEHQPVQ
jgi:AmmeMemoRadiSam system protein A